MSKTREEKRAAVAFIEDRLGRMSGAVLADFTGVTVRDLEDLRRSARAAQCEYLVVKKTLFARAADATGVPDAAGAHVGGLSVLFGFADAVAPAKIAKAFAKAHEAFRVLGGFLRDGAAIHVLNEAQAKQLGELPSRDELVAKAVGSIASPLRGLVGALAGNHRNLVQVLNAIRATKA